MRGMKRAALIDSAPIFNFNDSSMQIKRVITGSPFEAKTSNPQLPLDLKRAESSKQHESSQHRACKEKFSDVVNWLKANAAKGESHGELRSNDAQTKPAFGIDKISQKVVLDKPGFPPFSATTTPSFGSWPSGNVLSNDASFSFGDSC